MRIRRRLEKIEKAFWEEVSSGKYEQKPVILKK